MADEAMLAQLQARLTQAEAEIVRLATALATNIPTDGGHGKSRSIMEVKAYSKLDDYKGDWGADK